MLIELLHVAALTLPSATPLVAVPAAGDAQNTAPIPVAVVYGEDLETRDRIRQEMAVWDDPGGFLVGEASRQTLRWIEGMGLGTHALGKLPARVELYAFEVSYDGVLDRVENLGGRTLFQHGSTALIATPVGSLDNLLYIQPDHLFGHGVQPILRQAQTTPSSFVDPREGSGGARGPRAVDPRIQAVVDQVQGSNVDATVSALSAIYSRRADNPGSVTAQNLIEGWFQAMGYTTSLQDFGYLSQNVVAELPGTVDPDRYIVLGGHYDSIAGSGAAPGADDNASGTGGVLEAARVLAAGGPYSNTIRFIAFSGEEFGLYGSEYAASLSASLGEDIIAMLNMDMCAYRAPGDALTADFVTSNSTTSLVNFCVSVGADYVPNWASNQGSLSGGTSDHRSYTDHGFPAVFYFEDIGNYSPYIHSANDTNPLSSNSFELAEMMTKGMVAAAATLAEPVDLSITHTPLVDTQNLGPYDVECQVASLTGANVTSVVLNYATDGGNFTQVAMTNTGGLIYASQIPGAGSPVVFSYFIEAFDDQGGDQTSPSGMDLGEPPYSFFVGEKVVYYFNDFEAAGDEGWTHGQVATQDDWQRGVPQGKAGDPSSAFSGSKVWANDLGASGWNGEYATNTHNWLASPVFDLSAANSVTLEFQRWLTVEDGSYDQAQILVNGTVAWQNAAGADHLDSGWTQHSLDITSLAAGNSSVQIEFRMISDGGVEFGGWNIDDFSLVKLGPVSCPPPVNYCTTSPNSVGAGAVMTYTGTLSVAANDLVLLATDAPATQFGVFFYGPAQISVPFGNGTRCVGAGGVGTFRLPVISTDGAGIASWNLDITNPPSPVGQIDPGETWNFQFWYRDPAGGGSQFNVSDGLEATFCQ